MNSHGPAFLLPNVTKYPIEQQLFSGRSFELYLSQDSWAKKQYSYTYIYVV